MIEKTSTRCVTVVPLVGLVGLVGARREIMDGQASFDKTC